MTEGWNDFYSAGHVRTPSAFGLVVAVQLRHLLPAAVIDLGCGNGRDTLRFTEAGRYVAGVDISESGIAAARTAAAAKGAVDWWGPHFKCADLSTVTAWSDIGLALDAAGAVEQRVYYGRFLLHSLDPEQRKAVIHHLADAMREGDLALFEFRTTADAALPKMRQHARWFVEPQELEHQMVALGLRMRLDEVGTGLARWGREDPHVARVTITKEWLPNEERRLRG